VGTPRVPGRLLVAMGDPVLLGRLESLAARRGLDLHAVEAGSTPLDEEPPLAIIAELELPGVVDRIAEWRRRWPDALLAGSIRIPDQELWHGALAAGADLVANRGALIPQLDRALDARLSGSGEPDTTVRLAVRLMERDGDGLVGRLPDAPGGSIAVFRVAGRLHAVRDECPHAGASLADGELQGAIITCPRHGSQFDVTTGSRERGPSDFPIRTYRVIEDQGRTLVEVQP
ncbi:MAG TPA: Rieske 2Fe-2S domain-containing protein, partial [Candidatus Deferrimicrobium sp.]|nr:Rieske 2Fe-2S domain-containing protein [Candidatus Deferrimicrobium sp.]